MQRITGLIFSGFMVRIYAAIFAVVLAHYAWDYVSHVFAQVNHGLNRLG